MDTEETRALFAYFNLGAKSSTEQRKCLLKTASASQVKAIQQLVYNILFNDSLDLTQSQRATIEKRLNSLKLLASSKVPIKEKRKLLIKQPELSKFLCDIGQTYLSEYL
jgi:hypothetical protein